MKMIHDLDLCLTYHYQWTHQDTDMEAEGEERLVVAAGAYRFGIRNLVVANELD